MTLSDNKPFVAVSTPAGTSGIAVIRASGEGVSSLADKCIRIIRTAGDYKTVSAMPGYVSAYADFYNPENGSSIDKVVVTHYVAPYSYTGSEMIEISCHGGTTVKQEILCVLYSLGMRPAEPGEFTKTAFIAGKLDLSEAEAVMDVINADSVRTLRAANSQLNGKLTAKLNEVEDSIYKAMALIEMIIEFPEHDDTPENDDQIKEMLTASLKELEELKASYGKGKILTESLSIALCGLPNSGKSSLLNTLAGYERAIVTNVPGTTRDTLELRLDIDGIPVTLVDTAGMRETSDKIEAMGVELARKAFTDADMVLYLAASDSDATLISEQMKELIDSEAARKTTLVLSKSDLGENANQELIVNTAKECGIMSTITISTINETNIDELRKLIVDYYENAGGMSSSELIVINRRHFDKLDEAAMHMTSALGVMNDGLGVEFASGVLRSALDSIGEITGKTVSARLADEIFAGFCIGK